MGGQEPFGCGLGGGFFGVEGEKRFTEPLAYGIDGLASAQPFAETGNNGFVPEDLMVLLGVGDGIRLKVVFKGQIFGNVGDEGVFTALVFGAAQHLLHAGEIGKGGKVNGVLAFVEDAFHARAGEADADGGGFFADEHPFPVEKRRVPGEEPDEAHGGRLFDPRKEGVALLAARLGGFPDKRIEGLVRRDQGKLRICGNGGSSGDYVRVVEEFLEPVHSTVLLNRVWRHSGGCPPACRKKSGTHRIKEYKSRQNIR